MLCDFVRTRLNSCQKKDASREVLSILKTFHLQPFVKKNVVRQKMKVVKKNNKCGALGDLVPFVQFKKT